MKALKLRQKEAKAKCLNDANEQLCNAKMKINR